MKRGRLDNKIIALLILTSIIAGFFVGSLTGEATRRKGPGGGPSPTCTDYDKDTYFGQSNCPTLQDCNDNNPNIHPYATEICGNNMDDDCVNGDIGLCQASIRIKARSTYSNTEEVIIT